MFPKDGATEHEIRFAGFTDPWEQRKLGDFGSVSMCKRIFKEQTSDSGDVPFFKIGTFGAEPDAFISSELFEEYRQLYPFPKAGDILISAAGTIGRTVVYRGEDAYFQDSNIVWLDHDDGLSNGFLLQYLKGKNWSSLEGSTLKRHYNKDLLESSVSVPCKDEQAMIGHFFNQLDNLITLHQRARSVLLSTSRGKGGGSVVWPGALLICDSFIDLISQNRLFRDGRFRMCRYPRPIPKMLTSSPPLSSGASATSGGTFVCSAFFARASTGSPSARKNSITSLTLCCRDSLSSP